jgi:hypothetical protein
MSERHDHSKKLIGTIRIQLFAKSFICRCTTFWRGTGFGAISLVRVLRRNARTNLDN